jgi:hypothetical protein
MHLDEPVGMRIALGIGGEPNRRSGHVGSEKAMETPWLFAASLELRGIR